MPQQFSNPSSPQLVKIEEEDQDTTSECKDSEVLRRLEQLPKEVRLLMHQMISILMINYNNKDNCKLKREQPERLRNRFSSNCDTILELKNSPCHLFVKALPVQESDNLFQLVSFAFKVQLELKKAASFEKPPPTMTQHDISPILKREKQRRKLKGIPFGSLADLLGQETLEMERHDKLRGLQIK